MLRSSFEDRLYPGPYPELASICGYLWGINLGTDRDVVEKWRRVCPDVLLGITWTAKLETGPKGEAQFDLSETLENT